MPKTDKLLGEKMYRNMYDTDFYDECWANEASKDEMQDVELVYVLTESEMKKLIRTAYEEGASHKFICTTEHSNALVRVQASRPRTAEDYIRELL